MTQSLHDLAESKVMKILGEREGPRVMRETLAEVSVSRIETSEQLHAFAQALERRGSFSSAVAAVLFVQLSLRG